MTEWIKCSEQLPKSKRSPYLCSGTTESYCILVNISGTNFIGYAYGETPLIYLKTEIIFDMSTHKWLIPKHFREPDYWMELPELPHD